MLNKFETEDISKLLVQFSLPAIAGMIIHSCYNIVSRMFVGNMGNDGHLGLAALAVVFPVMLLFFSICVLFGSANELLNFIENIINLVNKYK